jgi:hypothetical protein
MRELLAEEMRVVAGGLKPQQPITLRGFTVRPPRPAHQSLPYHPPSTGGGQNHGGGGGGGRAHVGASGGGLSPQTMAGISRIKDQLGVDLTAYAQMSPTLAQAISLGTATFNFDFKWDNDSHTNWSNQVSGTISINSAAKTDMPYFVQQIAHELGHVDHRVADRASQTPTEVYVSHYLEAEGYATLANERIQHEIYASGGGDIHIAGKVGNRAFFDAEYSRWANGQQTYSQAASNIGTHYGRHENTTVNNVEKSYHEHYISEHRRLGGHD